MVGQRAVSATASAALHGTAILTLILVMRLSSETSPADAAAVLVPDHMIWVPHDAFGGGSDGGGQRATAPPRRVRAIGADPTSVAISPQPSSTASAIEPPEEISTLPAKPMGDATQILPGAIDSAGVSAGPGDVAAGTATTPDQGGPGQTPGGGFGDGATPYGPGVTMPAIISRVDPKYTVQAMQLHVQGTAVIECVVRADGTVGDARVIRSLDRRYGLDEEGLRAVRQWRFKPGLLNGRPVAVVVTIELMFSLR